MARGTLRKQLHSGSSDPPFESRTTCFVCAAGVALCVIRFYIYLLAGSLSESNNPPVNVPGASSSRSGKPFINRLPYYMVLPFRNDVNLFLRAVSRVHFAASTEAALASSPACVKSSDFVPID